MLTNKCEYYHHLLFSIIVLDGFDGNQRYILYYSLVIPLQFQLKLFTFDFYILIHSAVCLLLLQDVNHLVFGSSFNESVTPMTTEEAMAQFQHYL